MLHIHEQVQNCLFLAAFSCSLICIDCYIFSVSSTILIFFQGFISCLFFVEKIRRGGEGPYQQIGVPPEAYEVPVSRRSTRGLGSHLGSNAVKTKVYVVGLDV
jgi:hypothetical protein